MSRLHTGCAHSEREPHSNVCRDWPDCQCDGADCNPFGPRRPFPIGLAEVVLLDSLVGLALICLLPLAKWLLL